MTREEKIKQLQKNIQQTIIETGEEEGKYNCEIKDYYYKDPQTGDERLEYSNIFPHYGHLKIMKKHFPDFRVIYCFNNETKEWLFTKIDEETGNFHDIPWCYISDNVLDELLAVKSVPNIRIKKYIKKPLAQQYQEHWNEEHSAISHTDIEKAKAAKRPAMMCLRRIGIMFLAIPAALLWLPFSLVEWIATGKNERADRMMFNIEKLAN